MSIFYGKRIKNKNEEMDPLKLVEYMNTQVLQASMELKEKIGITENQYHTIFGGGFGDPRGYYIFGVIDDVLRASMGLIQNTDQMKDRTPIKDKGDGLKRIVFESIYFQQRFLSRKLFENLVKIIIFSQNNKQENFKLYLLLNDLKEKISKRNDLEDFYNCKNSNLELQIASTINSINQLVGETQLTTSVFSKLDFPLKEPIYLSKIEKSIRQLFQEALKLSYSREKVPLGDSYNTFYGDISQNMHAGGEGIKNIDYDFIIKEMNYIWLMSINILIRLKNLLEINIKNIDHLEDLLNSEKSDAGKIFKSQTEKSYEIGDIVFVFNDLVEVIGIINSEYGYKSFKIKYLGRVKPIPEIDEDIFPSKFFQVRILSKKNTRYLLEAIFNRMIQKGDQNRDIYTKILNDKSLSDEHIYDSFKEIFIDLHNTGILIHMYK